MKKKVTLLIISIILVLIILAGTTYSVLFKVDTTENQSYTTGILDITSNAINNSVTLANGLPISDNEGKTSTPYTFKISNVGNLKYKFDVKLLSTNSDTTTMINPDYIKIMVDNNTPVKLSSLTDGVILSNKILSPEADLEVTIRMWLDEYTPNTEIGKTFTAKITTTGQAVYYDGESVANAPALTDALIPVVYNESTSTWVKADTTSSTSTYGWYDYDQKKWANAVLVSSTNRSTYKSASAGTTIADADILAFYVWIPRYKYKVWNKNKVIGVDSYNAQTTGVDIVFEDDTSSTGTISCTYSYKEPSTEAGSPNETCTGSNGDYYTHPAFTFGDQELTGFWMGKFELSSETPNATNGGGGSTTLTPRILPNVIAWRRSTISSFWKVIYDMQKASNIYGLPTSRTNTDSHMLTNMEWGATYYLTNSKYGRCTSGSCTMVTINNCKTKITGIGANNVAEEGSSTTCTTDENKYNGTKGILASTTGNITGVYDMSGGSWEYVMANSSSKSGFYSYEVNDAGTNFTYSVTNAKYLTTYAYGTTINDQAAYNRGRLGDAIIEMYNQLSFRQFMMYDSQSWLERGCNAYGNNEFCILSTSDDEGSDVSGVTTTRAILAIY